MRLALAKEHLDISICSLDTSTATSSNFKNLVGFDGKHKKFGTKISVVSDQNGLPYDIEFGKGSKHDLKFLDDHKNDYLHKKGSKFSLN